MFLNVFLKYTSESLPMEYSQPCTVGQLENANNDEMKCGKECAIADWCVYFFVSHTNQCFNCLRDESQNTTFINDTEEEIQILEKLISEHHVGGLCFFHSRASAATNYEGEKDGMKLNKKTTKVMRNEEVGRRPKTGVIIDAQKSEEVTENKYLGR